TMCGPSHPIRWAGTACRSPALIRPLRRARTDKERPVCCTDTSIPAAWCYARCCRQSPCENCRPISAPRSSRRESSWRSLPRSSVSGTSANCPTWSTTNKIPVPSILSIPKNWLVEKTNVTHWLCLDRYKRRAIRIGVPAKFHPAAIVLAGHRRMRNPLHPTYRDDGVAIIANQRLRLLGEQPVGIDQHPCRQDRRQIADHRMQDVAAPRRIGDETLGVDIAW